MELIKRGHPLYRLYYLIKTRCYNASPHNYPFYQGKGIELCDTWLNNRNEFFDWALNNGWEQGLSIDRIDSNKNYDPSNCRFISIAENSKNKKLSDKGREKLRSNSSSILTIDDVKKIKEFLNRGLRGTEIASLFSVHKSCIYKIKHGKRWKNIQIAI